MKHFNQVRGLDGPGLLRVKERVKLEFDSNSTGVSARSRQSALVTIFNPT